MPRAYHLALTLKLWEIAVGDTSICRRSMLLAGASFAFLRAAPATAQQSEKTEFMKAAIADIDAHNKQVDQDMELAAKEKRQAPQFLKIPKVTPFVDWDYFFLEGPLEWIANPGQTFSPVQVPKGFVTDLASVPAILWSVFPKTGRYAYAAIVHDYLYWTQAVSREEADSVLKAAMEDARVDAVSRVGFYAAVRTFGDSPWERNRKAKGEGESRELAELPSDPLISWAEWKKKPGVFRPR